MPKSTKKNRSQSQKAKVKAEPKVGEIWIYKSAKQHFLVVEKNNHVNDVILFGLHRRKTFLFCSKDMTTKFWTKLI